MAEHWQQLLANFAIVALFISVWVNSKTLISHLPRFWRHAALGLTMGIGALVSMLLGIHVGGALFDLRLTLIAIAGFFGGPVGAIVAIVPGAIYRIIQIGGAATPAAISGLITAAAFGVAIAMPARHRIIVGPLLLAVSVSVISAGTGLLASSMTANDYSMLSVAVSLINGLATAGAAMFILRHRKLEHEHSMMHAAFIASPDLQYIKTREGRFVLVNVAQARFHGLDNVADLKGRTDADFLEPKSAAKVQADDRQIIESGQPKVDLEEMLVGPSGEEQWFSTSKVPIFNPDREVVGLAGWTRDITEHRRLQAEVAESRNRLDYVLSEITDGIAMFDADGTLVYCNERYREHFIRTAEFRVPGTSLRAILEKVLEVGEQIVPPEMRSQWLEEISLSIYREDEQEVQLFDGRWLYVRTRPTANGAAMVVVSDVTKIKQAEHSLRTMTEQLKILASTDGLTGLTNRRAFDVALEGETSRCRRSGEPLSILMVDVDRFKAYNDLYGHPAGDEVLKRVGTCLKESLRRPTDLAARYGGEEFVAILPGTDEDGAFFIADSFRAKLRALNLLHEGSEKSVVTASVGLATFTSRDAGMNANELVRRADEALYNAKGAGRDRVTGWRPRHEVRPVGGLRA